MWYVKDRGMGGREAMKDLLSIDPHVKAIISCGYPDDRNVPEFSDCGFCGAIAVPYDLEKTKEMLSNLLM